MHSESVSLFHYADVSGIRCGVFSSEYKESSLHTVLIENIQNVIGINAGTVVKSKIYSVNSVRCGIRCIGKSICGLNLIIIQSAYNFGNILCKISGT